jgi:hypothetical protein
MTPKVKSMYKAAKADSDFCDAISISTGNYVPSALSDDLIKTLFATMYMGWLLSELGTSNFNEFYENL